MGMAPLALYLRDLGHTLFLQDDQPNPAVLPFLEGPRLHWVETGDSVDCIEVVVYSSAIAPAHPLRFWATKNNLPQFSRGIFLAQCLAQKRLIAVAGSHGKTTTTALLIHILRRLNFPISFLLGALWQRQDLSPALCDLNSEWVVAEIDESDGSILSFHPEITVVLNLDWDHPAHYTSPELLESTFEQFFQQTKICIVIPRGNALLDRLAERATAEVLYFDPVADAKDIEISRVNLPNMGAALKCAEFLTNQHALSLELFEDFPGVKRRQECHWKTEKLEVWGDYAHHPVEVEAFLQSMQSDDKEIAVVFQPHRYTRTAQYAEAFAEALAVADHVFLLPVYAASEAYDPNGTIDRIAQFLEKPFFMGDAGDASILRRLVDDTSVPLKICFVGAGDIENLISIFVKLLQGK